jgi:hypothetical protein
LLSSVVSDGGFEEWFYGCHGVCFFEVAKVLLIDLEERTEFVNFMTLKRQKLDTSKTAVSAVQNGEKI